MCRRRRLLHHQRQCDGVSGRLFCAGLSVQPVHCDHVRRQDHGAYVLRELRAGHAQLMLQCRRRQRVLQKEEVGWRSSPSSHADPGKKHATAFDHLAPLLTKPSLECCLHLSFSFQFLYQWCNAIAISYMHLDRQLLRHRERQRAGAVHLFSHIGLVRCLRLPHSDEFLSWIMPRQYMPDSENSQSFGLPHGTIVLASANDPGLSSQKWCWWPDSMAYMHVAI